MSGRTGICLRQFSRVMNLRSFHQKCRNTEVAYLRSSVFRQNVSDSEVDWQIASPGYNPPYYTDTGIKGKPWSDEELIDPSQFNFNSIDGKVDRRSFMGSYTFDSDGRPLNPMGRTGMRGRGVLGRWGPNHAADPVVTRRKNGILEFVAIQRRDTGEWAIPGGMVDAGEIVSETLKREFAEEALGGVKQTALKTLWDNPRELYRGYVDDPRNTDNSWMETVVMNFHDNFGLLSDVNLQAGDDAVSVRWIPVQSTEKLYASHNEFIQLLKKIHNEM